MIKRGQTLEDVLIELYAGGYSAIEAQAYLRSQGVTAPYVEIKKIYLKLMGTQK